MRDFDHYQLSLMSQSWVEHPHAEELAEIGEILDCDPSLVNLVGSDLGKGLRFPQRGARGLSPFLVLRALIIKQMHGFSYEELAFHLTDSVSFRAFCGIDPGQRGPKRSALQKNIKRIRAETLAAINTAAIKRACADGYEDFDRVRYDSTVVACPIHHPTDSSLLWDCVRVLTRNLARLRELVPGLAILIVDHQRRAKRRHLKIQHAGSRKDRKAAYRDLLKVTQKTVGYAEGAVIAVANADSTHFADTMSAIKADAIASELSRFCGLTRRVMDQAKRRVLEGESVPVAEKIVSIFEEHTDIIVKDRRETLFGHKIFLSSGTSGLILDCVIAQGNPADSEWSVPLVWRHLERYDEMPRQIAFDGGFASRDNLANLKREGIEDVAFNKRRGIEISEMARSSWVYKKLSKFRAGIEAGISFLKRVFGWSKCTWSSLPSFEAYVLASVTTCNLLTLARHRIRQKSKLALA